MSDTRVRRVLIAGGGIGGLAAAVALRQRGFDVLVLERGQELRDGGAGLHVWTNGMLALDALGLADKVLETAPAQRVCHFSSWTGEVLAAWPVGRFAERYGQPTVAVERSVLHGILSSALPRTALRTGARVCGIAQDRHGVRVRLADGTEATGDVLIGADGVYSTVRDALHGPSASHYTGYVAWRGRARLRHELIPPGTFNGLIGRGDRFTYYDVGPGIVHWMSVANAPQGGRDAPGVLAVLAERHRGWPAPIQDLLAATPESDVTRYDVVDRAPDRRWGHGRVTLLGDAAHPITFNIGQGACQALEDALVLADRLGSRPWAPAEALRAYESERRARTAAMQRQARWIGRVNSWANPWTVRLREAAMRRLWDTRVFAAAERSHIAYGTRWAHPQRSHAPAPQPPSEAHRSTEETGDAPTHI
ncbi:FAD-dependent monooxygenase [Streptomyces sp. NPDC041068]|uniref:FAD-dependent oxidoreductase n=1 Tax=Streptomyces sp. NPDC041068 TaxID=3155130 RepID=UPI0033D102CA